MKNTVHCPKCKSDNILKIEGGRFKNHNFIYNGYLSLGLPIDKYVCGSCGFVETWMDKKSIEKI